MTMRWPRAVLFDLDGTLIDSAPSIAEALNVAITRRGGKPVDAARVAPWISLGAAELVRKALGALAADPHADVAEFRAIYGALAPDAKDLYFGVSVILAQLDADGIVMAVCTNKPQALAERVIQGVGLAPYVRAVVGGDPGLPPKPHPDSLLIALDRVNASPGDTAYVGDSEIDAAAAAAARLPFVLATFGYASRGVQEIACMARFDAFPDLPAVLADLASRMRRAG